MKTTSRVFMLLCLLLNLRFSNPAEATSLLLDQTSSDYFLHADTVRMISGAIFNLDPQGLTSGDVSLEVWAVSQQYFGGALGDAGTFRLATKSLGPITADDRFLIDVTAPYVRPPTGTYHIAMVVVEADQNGTRSVRSFKQLPQNSFPGLKFVNSTGASWTSHPTQVRLQAQGVQNTWTNGSSGSFRLELMAFPVATGPFNWNSRPAVSHLIAAYNFPTVLAAGASTPAVDQLVPFTLPPSGTYHSTLLLTEYNGAGWTPRDFVNLQQFTYTAPSRVNTPTIEPPGGTFVDSVTVRLRSNEGADIYWTDQPANVVPVPNIPYDDNDGLVVTPETFVQTLRVIAKLPGKADSDIASASFTVTASAGSVARPDISPIDPGPYQGPFVITITCATPDADIYYSAADTDTDTGPDPGPGVQNSWLVPAAGFYIPSSKVIKAKAYKNGVSSATAAASYQIVPLPGIYQFPDRNCAWEVLEIGASASFGNVRSLAAAETLAASAPQNWSVSRSYQSMVINRNDPDSPGGGGFFRGDLPFAVDNLTPHGLNGINGGDDDDFVLQARTYFVVTEEDNYTFGFSSDDGARLKVYDANFISSTRLNPDNPANPAHNGNTLTYPEGTGNSDTLGVCHLVPRIYALEFLTWEGAGGAYCEVFAARGAKTAMDGTFRLVGDITNRLSGNSSRIAEPGWQVMKHRKGATSLPLALGNMYAQWIDGFTVKGLRFTTANDAPDRDPVMFVLEGSMGSRAEGPWIPVASGPTKIETLRHATNTVTFQNPTGYASYRLTFPTTRSLNANSVQIAEVGFLDDQGLDVVSPGDYVVPTSANSPAGETADKAIDKKNDTKYLNFDRENAGIAVAPGVCIHPTINFHDPENGGGGHGFSQTAFPFDTAGDDNNFAIGARATLLISQPGDYTFCLLGDDGSRFRILGSGGWTVSSPDAAQTQPQALPDGMQVNNCCDDVFGTVNLAAGSYELELIYNEIGGGAYIGLWSAFGRHTSFDPLRFSLLSADSGAPVQQGAPLDLLLPNNLQPPYNDNFVAPGRLVGLPAQTIGCNIGATLEHGEMKTVTLVGKTIWWEWTAPVSAQVEVDAEGSDDFQTMLGIWTGDAVNGLTNVASGNEILGENRSRAHFHAVSGVTYRIQAGGWDGAAGRIVLNIKPRPAPPEGDSFNRAEKLATASSLSVSGSTAGANAESGEPDHYLGFGNAQASAWFTWTAPFSGQFMVDTTGSRFDTVLTVYRGDAINALTVVATDNDSGPPVEFGRLSSIVLDATAGVTYRIALDGMSWGEKGDFVLNITPVPKVTSFALTASGTTRTFTLGWRSEPFTTYRIERSSDLTSWAVVASGFASTGTESELDIAGLPASWPKQFFRVRRE